MTKKQYQDTVDYLNEIRDINKSIKIKQDILDEQRELLFSIKGMEIKERVSGGRKDRSPVEEALIKFLKVESNLVKQIMKLTTAKLERINLINEIDDLKIRNVMECRYIKRQGWSSIITDLHYDKSLVYRWHKQGIEFIYKSRLNRLEYTS